MSRLRSQKLQRVENLTMQRLVLTLVVGISLINAIPCIKWRETKNCDPNGLRNPANDASCSTVIKGKRSGYCECTDRKRAHPVDCDHHEFTCDVACEKDESANLKVPSDYRHVTCGSSIRLVHEMSRYNLHSHEINYGSGSGQQSVTAHGSSDDPNSLWLVKEGDDETPCVLGQPIKCGAQIRLEHISTRRNLHSHAYRSPLTSNAEVSGYGVAGEGDSGDTWIVECEEAQQCDAANKCEDDALWKRYEMIKLRHLESKKYLLTSPKSRFNENNCPHCPINGQQEIAASSAVDEMIFWFAGSGVYISSSL